MTDEEDERIVLAEGTLEAMDAEHKAAEEEERVVNEAYAKSIAGHATRRMVSVDAAVDAVKQEREWWTDRDRQTRVVLQALTADRDEWKRQAGLSEARLEGCGVVGMALTFDRDEWRRRAEAAEGGRGEGYIAGAAAYAGIMGMFEALRQNPNTPMVVDRDEWKHRALAAEERLS